MSLSHTLQGFFKSDSNKKIKKRQLFFVKQNQNGRSCQLNLVKAQNKYKYEIKHKLADILNVISK